MSMEIGVINSLVNEGKCFDHVSQFGLKVCQLCSWDVKLATKEIAATVVAESKRTGVRVCALWGGVTVPGNQGHWNFQEGPETLGLVPLKCRATYVDGLKKWADFASWIGAPALITHCGFIPENPCDPNYQGVVDAIKDVAERCKKLGIGFWFETGQETPVTVLRTIERVGTGNLGINLDPANLILYGRGNPIDSLDVFGKYVKNIHVKDGLYPTDGDNLGKEVKVGEGKVRFPEFMRRLKEIGYTGELIIEREISGDEQSRDIRDTVENLKKWLAA